MDDAVSRQGTNRRCAPQYPSTRHHMTFAFGSHRVTFHGARSRRAPGLLHAEVAELRAARAVLVRLYAQEQHTIRNGRLNARESTLNMVRSSRATAERRYVSALIRYCRAANRMTRAQATELQKHFTRERMGDMAPPNSNYLLGMYPHELY